MPASLAPLRLLLGGMCAFFAFYLGRSVAARAHARATNAQVTRWALRVVVTALGTAWGGFGTLTFLLLGLAAVSAGFGYRAGRRPPKPNEDLAKLMFPRD